VSAEFLQHSRREQSELSARRVFRRRVAGTSGPGRPPPPTSIVNLFSPFSLAG
jgi:hypothetical protein